MGEVKRNVEIYAATEKGKTFLFNCLSGCGKQAGPFGPGLNQAIKDVLQVGWFVVEHPERGMMQIFCSEACADWAREHNHNGFQKA